MLQGGFERTLGAPTQLSILNETQRYVNIFFTPRLRRSLYQRKDLPYKQIAEQLNRIFLLAHVKVAPEVTPGTELLRQENQFRREWIGELEADREERRRREERFQNTFDWQAPALPKPEDKGLFSRLLAAFQT